MKPSPPSDAILHELAGRAGDAALLAEVESIYAEVQRAIAKRRPICQLSSMCCQFIRWGHLLYVTTPELVRFLADYRSLPQPDGPKHMANLAAVAEDEMADDCPVLIGGRCSVHAIRPLGCRIFFCQEGALDWVMPLYERMQELLRRTCQTHCLPYAYVEWTATLSALHRVGLITPVSQSS